MVSDCIHNTLLISIENKLVEHAFFLNCFFLSLDLIGPQLCLLISFDVL